MSIMMGDLRAALISAGTPEALADRAATEVATYEGRLANIGARLQTLVWMATIQTGLTLALVGSFFAMWLKLGEISGAVGQLARAIH